MSVVLCRSHSADAYRPLVGSKKRCWAHTVQAGNGVIQPWANRKDAEHDVAKEVRGRIQFVFARTVREVLDVASVC
jgi:hypothetical protein